MRRLRLALLASALLAWAWPATGSDSLWPELVARMQLLEQQRHPKVRQWLARCRQAPHETRQLLVRARPLLWHLHAATQRRNLPAELALLPAIESAFRLTARSGQQAVGLWQFRPATARRFGLRIDDWYDGRLDALRATEAALDYLEYLRDRFDDWLLAVAAYNAGEGRVAAALRRAGDVPLSRAFWATDLPTETDHHVPRWLALAAVVRDPGSCGIDLPAVPDRPLLRAVTTPGQSALVDVARLSGADPDRLRRLNPALRRAATPPQGPHRWLLDEADAARLEAAMAAGRVPRLRLAAHRVAPGETLSHIATRSHTTVAHLRALNGLRGNLIRAGRELLVPVGLQPPPPPRPVQAGPPGWRRVEHRVAPGESLWTIARRYGTQVRQIARWNGMHPRDTLRAGRSIVVYTPPDSG